MDVPHRFKHLLESCALWLPLRVRNIETGNGPNQSDLSICFGQQSLKFPIHGNQ